ncbi:MAG: alpha-1,4-glucan--maltose-1-phosphate maltosyltransferase [Gemmatimonadota bacterium]|nr:MAG: alpha-1,4-glucan--maltose-1-phosphate maltosyltransferase [Gemmatimonadota bacterium]
MPEPVITADPPGVIIETVTPQIDCGRHPVKRVVGDTFDVSAIVYKEGHDTLAARLLVRAPDSSQWTQHRMSYDVNFDRCETSFVLDRIGRWSYTVEAWPDYFATWRSELRKKLAAGLDVSSELLEGALLLRDASVRAAEADRLKLDVVADLLADESIYPAQRASVALDGELERAMSRSEPAAIVRYHRALSVYVDRERARFGAWYEMFPRSQGAAPGEHGTFKTAELQLPRLAALGFDVVYLPPIHPIGSTHRKGPNNRLAAKPGDPGSPWAIGSEHGGHTAVEPRLGTLRDFEHFVETARGLGLEVALDYALQCSPDHPWVAEHPEWFHIRPDGSIKYAENPPKKYEDIYPLNYWSENRQALWQASKEVFDFWIERGVRIFRVDNPHTKPFAFWEWIITALQDEHPDVIFLSEAFTRPARMKALAKLGFTQSYTYFTWRNTVLELRGYMIELTQTEAAEYFRPNLFTNTPDILNEFLQTGGRPAFRIRLLLAATLSPSYGIYSGFELCENVPREPGSEEYLDSEKYEIKNRDWDAPDNINADIRSINRIRRENRALQSLTNLSFHYSENDQILFYRKSAPGNELLIVVNMDPHQQQESTIHVPIAELGIGSDQTYEVEDLLTGERYTWRGSPNYVRLSPVERVGHILRLVELETGDRE